MNKIYSDELWKLWGKWMWIQFGIGNLLTLIVCFATYKKWVQSSKVTIIKHLLTWLKLVSFDSFKFDVSLDVLMNCITYNKFIVLMVTNRCLVNCHGSSHQHWRCLKEDTSQDSMRSCLLVKEITARASSGVTTLSRRFNRFDLIRKA